jgi:hypothetical protein
MTPFAILGYAIGISGAGFRITVHPAASADATLRVTIAAGKVHGVIAATTSIDWRRTTIQALAGPMSNQGTEKCRSPPAAGAIL